MVPSAPPSRAPALGEPLHEPKTGERFFGNEFRLALATNSKSSNLAKLKPGVGDGPSSSKPRIDSSASKKKIIGGSIRNSAPDSKSKSIFSSSSKMMKKTSAQTKDDKKTVTRTREKKVYSLAGQKFDVPEELLPFGSH
ncbi:uncharacterized protein LOC121782122 isoform X2 [Salvia splendens]|uniref:uncharacterized protein LOC121782122 isoform X2 n=1 Tax=Salvia splendens TaxID=180675 RepID=UPI001C262E82|nr:uncharacterized protein LOC121782122 isoform X2 [Salvia splendens]